ncbi:MAG: hypothetical protein Tsb0034_12440 [Ekhidna sp.]
MKSTILFIDDEEINLFVLSRRFQESYDVLTANTVGEAIDLIKEKNDQIRAVISDVKMPDKSGLELISEMQDYLKNVPCFLLTGYDSTKEIEEAIHAGRVAKLFKKPFNYNEINNTLQEYV